MHELSLAESVVKMVEELATKNDFDKVNRIRLGVGAMSGVVRESLEFCFSLVTSGTILDGSVVEMIDIPLRVACRQCGRESEAQAQELICGACGAIGVEIKDGRDFKLLDLEVESCAKTADAKQPT